MILAKSINRGSLLDIYFKNVKDFHCYDMEYRDGSGKWILAIIILKKKTLFWDNLGIYTD